MIDLAAIASLRELELGLVEAERQRLVQRARLLAELDRHRGRQGVGALPRMLESIAEPSLTRSEAEERMLGLVRRAGLPAPRVNSRLRGFEVDFLWPRHRLVVEADGFKWHGDRTAFDRDRRRDAELVAAGLRVIRVTWGQIVGEPEAVVARLAGAMAFPSPV